MRVQDWRGREIKVGTVVLYGAPATLQEIENQIAVVAEIGEPDVVTEEDEWGREYGHGYALGLNLRFGDGTSVELVVKIKPESNPDAEQVFEESGDIEVIETVVKERV